MVCLCACACVWLLCSGPALTKRVSGPAFPEDHLARSKSLEGEGIVAVSWSGSGSLETGFRARTRHAGSHETDRPCQPKGNSSQLTSSKGLFAVSWFGSGSLQTAATAARLCGELVAHHESGSPEILCQ